MVLMSLSSLRARRRWRRYRKNRVKESRSNPRVVPTAIATVFLEFDLDSIEEGEDGDADVEEVEVAIEDDGGFPLVGIGLVAAVS